MPASSSPPRRVEPAAGRVKTVQLADAPRQAPPSASVARRPWFAATPRTTWLIAPAFLSATLLAVAIVLHGPTQLWGVALCALFGIGLLWVLISMFFPGRADLACPRCQAEALERLSPDAVTGLRCSACGYEDADVSSWMIAEHEGVPLEHIVMENRGRKSPDAAPRPEVH